MLERTVNNTLSNVRLPVLSICIATYNRAKFIGSTIESIIPQLTDDVELLIVDGASSDDTDQIVSGYTLRDTRIRYVRLPEKGGVDQDYCKSVELARGEYCWLFTDDDLLKPGAVAAVKAAISKGNGLVVVNAEVRDNELEHTLVARKIDVHKDEQFLADEMEGMFVRALNHLSFIGAVVIRRSLWLSRERERYYGTEFVHVGVIFQKPLPEPTLIISEPYVCIRYGNGQWKSRGFEVWMFKWPSLVWSFAHISDKAKRSVTRREPWRNVAILLFERGIGAYSIKHYRKFISRLPQSVLGKLCAWAIARFPEKILANMLYYFCRIVMPDKMFLYDLNSNR